MTSAWTNGCPARTSPSGDPPSTAAPADADQRLPAVPMEATDYAAGGAVSREPEARNGVTVGNRPRVRAAGRGGCANSRPTTALLQDGQRHRAKRRDDRPQARDRPSEAIGSESIEQWPHKTRVCRYGNVKAIVAVQRSPPPPTFGLYAGTRRLSCAAGDRRGQIAPAPRPLQAAVLTRSAQSAAQAATTRRSASLSVCGDLTPGIAPRLPALGPPVRAEQVA
jgi:hypothetical protein